MNTNNYAVIMAGGVGSRFWPVSTKNFPKQFIDMLGTGKSLLRHTVDRFESLLPKENLRIATNSDYVSLVHEQLPELNLNQIVPEPAMRNTAPCILYSALKIYKQNPKAVMAVVPSDHWIKDENEFCATMEKAFDYCSKNKKLLTFGIQPTHAHTGYGYIEAEKTTSNFKKVLKFTEKPDIETAKSFLSSENYYWNSGIFVWSVQEIIAAFELHLPNMYTLFEKGLKILNTANEDTFISDNYAKSASVSIDYGIMEKANNTVVLPANFSWNDLGSWSSLHKEFSKNPSDNVSNTQQEILHDSTGNMIRVSKGKKVVIQGLDNFIVVENDDLIFICPKSEEQEIKRIREEVKEKFGESYI